MKEPVVADPGFPALKTPEYYENQAFADIRLAIGKGLETIQAIENPKLRIRSDEVVWVSVPARLDFGGGWSDTPPYCFEQGGSVLNAAVKFNGQYPIQVIGKRLQNLTFALIPSISVVVRSFQKWKGSSILRILGIGYRFLKQVLWLRVFSQRKARED